MAIVHFHFFPEPRFQFVLFTLDINSSSKYIIPKIVFEVKNLAILWNPLGWSDEWPKPFARVHQRSGIK